jgi:hypothetical protein
VEEKSRQNGQEKLEIRMYDEKLLLKIPELKVLLINKRN